MHTYVRTYVRTCVRAYLPTLGAAGEAPGGSGAGCFKCVSGCFKCVSDVFQMCFTCVSDVFHMCVSCVLLGLFNVFVPAAPRIFLNLRVARLKI